MTSSSARIGRRTHDRALQSLEPGTPAEDGRLVVACGRRAQEARRLRLSPFEVLEEPGCTSVGVHAPALPGPQHGAHLRRGARRSSVPAGSTGACRRGPSAPAWRAHRDVGVGEDPRGLGQADPVRRDARHARERLASRSLPRRWSEAALLVDPVLRRRPGARVRCAGLASAPRGLVLHCPSSILGLLAAPAFGLPWPWPPGASFLAQPLPLKWMAGADQRLAHGTAAVLAGARARWRRCRG